MSHLLEQVRRWHRLSLASVCLIAGMQVAAAATLPIPADTTVVIADQNEVLQTLLKASGYQARLGFKVEYANFAGGPAILEAFRANALDVALAASTPPIQAQAAGEQLPIIAAVRTARPAYQLAVRPGVQVGSLAQLKGKSIAYAEGTARQTFVLAALRQAHLTPKDVKLVPLRVADFTDAVRSGQVDVAPLIEPHFSRYIGTGSDRQQRFVPTSALAPLPTNLQYLYASASALQQPAKRAALLALASAWADANRWAGAHPQAWAKAYYEVQQGLGPEDAERIVAAEGAVSVPPLHGLIQEQQDTIDLIYAAGDIPERLDAKAEFDLSFDTQATQANTASGGNDAR